MRIFKTAASWGLAVLFAAGSVSAQSVPQAFKGAHIIPVNSKPIDNGVLVVQNGKIVSVGPANTRIPNNAVVHDVSGKVIMPGLIDSHSHIGGPEGGDRSSALNPEVRILDSVDPANDSIHRARSGGITSVNVMPGSGHLMSGQTLYLKLRKSNKIEDLLIYTDKENNIYGGMKMANGTNPRGNAPFPGTRGKAASMVRTLFVKAQEYQAKIKAANGDESKMPARDLQMEALVEILEGKRTVHNHTHRYDDILTVIRLQKEFGYRLVLHHVSEAHRIVDEIAASGAMVSVISLDSFGGKMEAKDLENRNAGLLAKAGVTVGYHTDDGITDSRLFLRSAAQAIRGGMSREKALESVTIANAKIMDIDDRAGTLEKGKDADFIILSGDPFSVYTHILETWIEGDKVWDRSNPEDLKFATGGYDVFQQGVLNYHTEGEW